MDDLLDLQAEWMMNPPIAYLQCAGISLGNFEKYQTRNVL